MTIHISDWLLGAVIGTGVVFLLFCMIVTAFVAKTFKKVFNEEPSNKRPATRWHKKDDELR